MSNTIPNTQDVIDSRDIIARIEELESEVADLTEEFEGGSDETRGKEIQDELTDSNLELASLKALADECEGCGDWAYGEALIRESYMKDYMLQMIDDCYPEVSKILGDSSGRWPMRCMKLDEDMALSEFIMDYTEVTYDGATYYIRS